MSWPEHSSHGPSTIPLRHPSATPADDAEPPRCQLHECLSAVRSGAATTSHMCTACDNSGRSHGNAIFAIDRSSAAGCYSASRVWASWFMGCLRGAPVSVGRNADTSLLNQVFSALHAVSEPKRSTHMKSLETSEFAASEAHYFRLLTQPLGLRPEVVCLPSMRAGIFY